MNVFHSCNETNIFIWWKMKPCSTQLCFASLNATIHFSPHENIGSTALINIHFCIVSTLPRKYCICQCHDLSLTCLVFDLGLGNIVSYLSKIIQYYNTGTFQYLETNLFKNFYEFQANQSTSTKYFYISF